MKKPGFLVLYLLLIIAQVLLNNFSFFERYVLVTFLPVMIMCIPVDKGTIFCMAVAFLTGFAVDFLGDGMLGLTSLSLVPVALARNGVISLVFGSELFARGENISLRKQGVGKMILGTLLMTAIFLAVYITADGAGTMPFLYNLAKGGVSLFVSTATTGAPDTAPAARNRSRRRTEKFWLRLIRKKSVSKLTAIVCACRRFDDGSSRSKRDFRGSVARMRPSPCGFHLSATKSPVVGGMASGRLWYAPAFLRAMHSPSSHTTR